MAKRFEFNSKIKGNVLKLDKSIHSHIIRIKDDERPNKIYTFCMKISFMACIEITLE